MTEYIYERPDKPAKVVRDGWNVHVDWDFKQREEIIRCKDCKYFDEIKVSYSAEPDFQCMADWCKGIDGDSPFVEPGGFCAWGIRREQ